MARMKVRLLGTVALAAFCLALTTAMAASSAGCGLDRVVAVV